MSIFAFFSKDFHPAFSRIAEIRAIVPSGTLLMDCTATETRNIQEESVSMSEVVTVKLSPNHSNIMYVERRRTDLETDFSESLSTLKEKQKDTLGVVYCRTLMICADLFSRFSYEMGKSQYYPSAPEQSENRLFGMFHASTPQHSKIVIMESLQDCHGTVRVVFASVAMGMGIHLHGVDTIIHYGAPSSIEDYFLASGRRGQSGDSAYSIVYRTPKDCQTGDWIAKKEPAFHDQE